MGARQVQGMIYYAPKNGSTSGTGYGGNSVGNIVDYDDEEIENVPTVVEERLAPPNLGLRV